MPSIAVISDVHANLPGLEATLEAIDRHAPDEIWCLGDIVGRGPDPEVVPIVRERCSLVLAGNHDAVITGRSDVRFGGPLGRAAELAAAAMSDLDAAWLRRLDPVTHRYGIQAVHASLVDPYWDFVTGEDEARELIDRTGVRYTLFGHTHEPVAWLRGDGVEGLVREEGLDGVQLDLRGVAACALNPGSVGCPQHGGADERASFMLLDTDTQTVRWERVAYDTAALRMRIRRLRLLRFERR